ncbi:MAG: hypothetical protein K2J73_08575 [Oscillospiraceae bacterium]|nr:hypothetical protein [Oscillospiraceae bacterium]
MAVKENLTMTSDFTIKAREVDFVTRFTDTWEALREIMGIMRPIEKTPGTTLTSYTASVTLENGDVPEGEEIPYSKAKVKPVSYADLKLKKYAKAVTIEDVEKFGATAAVQKTDEAFLFELQSVVMDNFYSFILTGSLTKTAVNLQSAIASAIGLAKDKFKKMHKNSSEIVVIVNTLDIYDYLAAAGITTQNAFGIEYLKNFLGAASMIISSEIPQGKVIATPAGNIDLYYINPAHSDFKQLGLDYTVQGETNLIGFHANGDYSHAVGESFALMGMKLWAEYLDGIAVVSIQGAGGEGGENDNLETQDLEAPDLSGMSKDELLAYAAENGVKGVSNADKKENIIAAIEAAM